MSEREQKAVRSGTGKWGQRGVPHRGWTCGEVEDLGPEDRSVCEMCEAMEIRFVHYMTHPEWDGALACGCVCAEHMAEDYVGPRRRQRELQNRDARRRAFPKRKGWKKAREKGTPHITVDGYHIMIGRRRGGFVVGIAPEGGSRVWGRHVNPTENAARLAAFDALEWAKG